MGEDIMYKKYILSLFLCNMVVLASFCCLKIAERSRFAATPAFQMQLREGFQEEEASSLIGSLDRADSGQRVIDYQVMERQGESLSEHDFQILCRIVEAEAGGEDMNGRILVANVILNRVKSSTFPNSVEGVVFQKSNGTFQFSPIRDGRYQRVRISDETVEAVERALLGEDYSEGALYFVSRKGAAPEKMQWFDNHLTRLFQYGGHEFFS
ncbi:MAG: cell wall hydrolase [Lachnospiraceae bacterium]|jgi:spore germination cell wall hydrolase CwlJ-like protein|nr:cell wall hydrolase [Lachnospiraceae bacterium]